MNKKFMVEVTYEETPQNIEDVTHEVTEAQFESEIDSIMCRYASHQLIDPSYGYKVNVVQV